jgi:chromosome segregation ATPase
LELEHFHAIDKRWEEIRKQGRALRDSIPAVQGELSQAMQAANESLAVKARRRLELETYFHERRRMSVWSTAEEIRAADVKIEKAQQAASEAADKALEDLRTQAAAEGKLATVEANLKLLQTELHRLQAELHGEPYFDPSLGLSKSPVFYRDKW